MASRLHFDRPQVTLGGCQILIPVVGGGGLGWFACLIFTCALVEPSRLSLAPSPHVVWLELFVLVQSVVVAASSFEPHRRRQLLCSLPTSPHVVLSRHLKQTVVSFSYE